MDTPNKIISACCGAAAIAIPLLFDAYGRTAYSYHIDIYAAAIFIFFNILQFAFSRRSKFSAAGIAREQGLDPLPKPYDIFAKSETRR